MVSLSSFFNTLTTEEKVKIGFAGAILTVGALCVFNNVSSYSKEIHYVNLAENSGKLERLEGELPSKQQLVLEEEKNVIKGLVSTGLENQTLDEKADYYRRLIEAAIESEKLYGEESIDSGVAVEFRKIVEELPANEKLGSSNINSKINSSVEWLSQTSEKKANLSNMIEKLDDNNKALVKKEIEVIDILVQDNLKNYAAKSRIDAKEIMIDGAIRLANEGKSLEELDANTFKTCRAIESVSYKVLYSSGSGKRTHYYTLRKFSKKEVNEKLSGHKVEVSIGKKALRYFRFSN